MFASDCLTLQSNKAQLAMNNRIELHFAPLQGFTVPEYRQAYVDVFGADAVDCFYTPFLRIHAGKIEARGLRDAAQALKAPVETVPQIIFGSLDEFDTLTAALRDLGAQRIDLNLGCPFMPQVRRGRGSGTLRQPQLLAEIAARIVADTAVEYSVKMRLGVEEPDECLDLVPILNDMPLRHVVIHPRTMRQQYGGEVHREAFERLAAQLAHPILYNGDVRSVDDIAHLTAAYPDLRGVMIGRGLLAEPWLATEWRTGETMPQAERLAALARLHEDYMQRLAARLCSPRQLLTCLKPFWEYLEPVIGHRPFRAIVKSRSFDAYTTAVASALNN